MELEEEISRELTTTSMRGIFMRGNFQRRIHGGSEEKNIEYCVKFKKKRKKQSVKLLSVKRDESSCQ